MPARDGKISTAPVTSATTQASIAGYYGLRITIATLRAISDVNELGIAIDADAWDRRVDEIAGLRR